MHSYMLYTYIQYALNTEHMCDPFFVFVIHFIYLSVISARKWCPCSPRRQWRYDVYSIYELEQFTCTIKCCCLCVYSFIPFSLQLMWSYCSFCMWDVAMYSKHCENVCFQHFHSEKKRRKKHFFYFKLANDEGSFFWLLLTVCLSIRYRVQHSSL